MLTYPKEQIQGLCCEPSCAQFFLDFSEMCGPSRAHVFFCESLYAKGMLKQKNAVQFFLGFF
jgi:hypothetical protein